MHLQRSALVCADSLGRPRRGLPDYTLLSAGEDLSRSHPITFVELRNKVAHGEIGHLVRDLSDYDPDAARWQQNRMIKCDTSLASGITLHPTFRKAIFAITSGHTVKSVKAFIPKQEITLIVELRSPETLPALGCKSGGG
jgi:hypothetical protein